MSLKSWFLGLEAWALEQKRVRRAQQRAFRRRFRSKIIQHHQAGAISLHEAARALNRLGWSRAFAYRTLLWQDKASSSASQGTDGAAEKGPEAPEVGPEVRRKGPEAQY